MVSSKPPISTRASRRKLQFVPCRYMKGSAPGYMYSSNGPTRSKRGSPIREHAEYRYCNSTPVWSQTKPPAPATRSSSKPARSPLTQSGSGTASSSMKATTSPAAARIPKLRDLPRCTSSKLITLTRSDQPSSNSLLPSVDGPFTTTTSKFWSICRVSPSSVAGRLDARL
ncbi:unannotated protein [freshwater metagenome]|uniref:Unannotated protein n=1 Tax=freshwater metagenome TaxID=449393 RepID=A0A6J7SIY0_9ZZZZ